MKTKLKELRNRKGLTQEMLANRAGVTRQTIIQLEKGDYNPSLWLAHDIAVELGTKIDELFIFESRGGERYK